MENTFLILLSTFNGEKYLRELLESLVKQENAKCLIIVRDDGSTDRTVQILESFSRLLDIEIHVAKNVGLDASFKHLMNLALNRDFDYLAFCDQDDVWLPDKLSRAVIKLKESKKSQYSSKRICFSNRSSKTNLFPRFDPTMSFKNVIFENSSAGCTFVITHEHFKNLMRLGCAKIRGNYDHVIQVMSVLGNESFFDLESRIHYRLHGENSIGILRLRNRTISKTAVEIQRKLRMLEDILASMGPLITNEDRKLANDLLCTGKLNKQSFRVLRLPKMRHKRREDFALKLFLLLKTV
jgi:glycosyltransferase involved in cell wall biosynthesis